MRRFALPFIATLYCATFSISSFAATSPEAIAGVWSCSGVDEHAGKFTEREVIRLVPGYHDAHSASFNATGTIAGDATYSGEGMVTDGIVVANFISTSDQTDHGILMGKIDPGTPIKMKGRYFETQQSKPNRGTETCTRTGD
ncbi:hypothetical protein [Paraburkholderia solisilvae]|uniref:DUF2147 domain-containing protein n=1 Tax=Paraburkholderia solisilvae TaxID=624376 RepID=A0A6J5F1B5_9BURK|nr:hypothetical protein [Paraburkholderia solisilvae]CAB3771497.1 hypothetical protein LMG29739_06050 [Paraburkholderia solisilvae]